MRTVALLAVVLFLGGCAKDNDDRAFFNSGWIKPEDGSNRRMYGVHERNSSAQPERVSER